MINTEPAAPDDLIDSIPVWATVLVAGAPAIAFVFGVWAYWSVQP